MSKFLDVLERLFRLIVTPVRDLDWERYEKLESKPQRRKYS